jgi:PAS domain S-box-containing protein
MNVLVIADHLFANSLVEEIHNRSGNFSFRLVECRYYAQGIERLGREPLDLVLLDLGSSEETFLKVQEQAGEVPILVITTKDNRDAAQDALNLGARDSLFKEDLEAELVVRAMRYTIERRWMELELRASEERSGILSSLMRNFAFSVLVEPDGRPVVEWITGAFTEITGYTAETLELGKSWKNLVAVEDRSCFDEHTRVLEEGEPHTVRFRFKTKDGGLRWIQIHSRAEIGEGTGRIVRVYGAGLDVSESKKLEHQLSEAKERYAGIFEGVSDAILMEDRRGNLLDANASACKLFGYLRKDLLTKKISDLIPKESSLLLADDTQELRQKIPGHPIEVTITTAGGEQIPAEVNISPYTVGFETVTLLVVRDISQRKQAEEAYRTLVERSLQELYIVQDGKIVFANQAAMRNTGYTLEELKDGLFEEVLSGIYGSDTGSLLGVSAPGRSRREFKRVRKPVGSLTW